MQSKSMACALLLLGTSLAFSQRGYAIEPTSDPMKFVPAPAPPGAYTQDRAHSSLVLRVDHLGFSNFTARFTHFDIQLQLNPAHLNESRVTVKIDPNSLESDNAPAGFLDMLRGSQWLDTKQFPELTFRSTRVELKGQNALTIHGELTLHGVTRPVVLTGSFNGGYAGHPMDPHARAGFSAHGSIKRSEYGVSFGVPAPGSHFGVGDDIDVSIETELSGPPLIQPKAG
jgi:polyisoprenoid-binding protein YceI